MFWETSHVNFFLLFHRRKSCSYLILGQIIIFLIPSGYKPSCGYPTILLQAGTTIATPWRSQTVAAPGFLWVPQGLSYLRCHFYSSAGLEHWAGLSEWRSKEWHNRQIPANAELQGKQISSRKSDREAWGNHYTVPCFLQWKCFSWEFRYAEYLQLELGRVWIL